ncbi:MAG: tetratricopeptide repeat protein [Candidatus Erginobacter occultus]|nr:tetratricopeptide repeat protein [Candidatus Erginobacter occultus]
MSLRWLIVAALIVVTLIVFGPAGRYDFVGWDDDIHVYNNPYLKPPTLLNILHFWKGPYEGLYIPATFSLWAPLTALSQSFSAEAAGTIFNPHIFHSANIIIHVLNVLLVFTILNRIFRDKFSNSHPITLAIFARNLIRGKKGGEQAFPEYRSVLAAGLGAALYAVHPLQVEPVVWVSSLKDLLCGFFSLLALWLYLSYARRGAGGDRDPAIGRRGHKKYAFYATGAFALALLSKPAAVPLPVIAWLLLHFRSPDSDFGRRRGNLKALSYPPHALLIGWLLISVPIIYMAKFAEQDIPLGFVAPLWARGLVAGDALGFYLFKLFVPLNLGIDYGRIPQLILANSWGYFTWLLLLFIAAACLLGRRRRQWLICLGIFIAGASPTLGLVPHGFQLFSTVADRFLYLAMLGPALAIGWAVMSCRNAAVIRVGVILVCLLGFRSVSQRRYWVDNGELFHHALEINERSYMAHYNLGLTLDGEAKPAEAIFHYEKALDIKPGYGRAHNNLGATLTRQGRLREAIGHFAEALRLEPGNEGAYFNLYVAHNVLGVELAEKGNLEEAGEHFSQALRLRPDYAEARQNLIRITREK